MINEQISEKEISLAVRIGKTTADELKKALEKLIAKLQENKGKTPEQSKEPKAPKGPELKSGKQTLKQLHKHNEGLSSIELKDPNLRKLYRAMKKDDIDFACVKDGKGKYTLFFKGKNAEEMTHAFKRYTAKMVKIADKKAIKAELREAKAAAKLLDTGRDKEKNKSKGAR
jgi:hypothetical protein